ncbi:hypothetical protein BH23CHL5_BH23CHL5_16640 [soil metagenome]
MPSKRTSASSVKSPVNKSDYVVIFDGGSIGNPGKGYGSYLLQSPTGKEVHERIEFPEINGPMTNNQAEYRTLIKGLYHLIELLGDRVPASSIRIEGDSQLVLNQLDGRWKVKHEGLKPLHEETSRLIKRFSGFKCVWHSRDRSVSILGH